MGADPVSNLKPLSEGADLEGTGGRSTGDLSIQIKGKLYSMLMEIRDGLTSPPPEGNEEQLVQIAITLLHRAVGKVVVIEGSDGPEFKFNPWREIR
jgi:hypothetical protein